MGSALHGCAFRIMACLHRDGLSVACILLSPQPPPSWEAPAGESR